MKKIVELRSYFLLCCFLFVFLFSSLGQAAAKSTKGTSLTKNKFNDRKGFLIGVGPILGGEVNTVDQVGGGLELRVGYGFNERYLLYYEGDTFFTQKSGVSYFFEDVQAKGQAFIWKNLYGDLGLGFTIGNQKVEGVNFFGNNVDESTTSVGFVLSFGIGYEFRLTRYFSISPEFAFNYRHVGGLNFVTPGLIVNCGWYF